MAFVYQKNVKAFFAKSPTPEEFRQVLAKEDLTRDMSYGLGHVSANSIIYNILTEVGDGRYMNVFFGFHPDIFEDLTEGDYTVLNWLKDGKNEYFVSLFRYYRMDELREIIDQIIGNIIESGDQEIFNLLVEEDYLNEGNRSDILKLAIKYNNIPVADFLLGEGTQVEPIHFTTAVLFQNIGMIHRMMMYGGSVNLQDPNDSTPLSVAFATHNIDVIREILGHGADVNEVPVWSKYSPLMLAVESSRLRPLVKELIAAGANVNYRTVDGETPLSVADNNEELRALLIKAGATDEGVVMWQLYQSQH